MNTSFLLVLARVWDARGNTHLCWTRAFGQLQQRARSTKKRRPRLAAPAAMLAHFHALLWLPEALRFNTLA